jgi:uncharacterized protein YcbK (DUF882 family)
VLAVISAESSGKPDAIRHEPKFEQSYIINNPTWRKLCLDLQITTQEAATSYGLMQLMFTTAYGYGCRSTKDALDPDKNIRYGVAHLAMLIKKHGTKEAALAAYNGGDGAAADLKSGKDTAATRYSRKVMALYNEYRDEALAAQPQTTKAKVIVPQDNYFANKEFSCKCGCGFCIPKPNLISTLNIIREVLGGKIIISSGCRCPKRNAAVGGVDDSNHTTGNAADIVSPKATAPEMLKLIRRLWEEGALPELAGLGKYPTFTHVDVLPKVAGRLRTWEG